MYSCTLRRIGVYATTKLWILFIPDKKLAVLTFCKSPNVFYLCLDDFKEQTYENSVPSAVLGTNEARSTADAARAVQSKQTPGAEEDLDETIVKVIGPSLNKDRELAPAVHATFAGRWAELVKLGLPKEERSELIKNFPRPKNCEFLDPPKLNKFLLKNVLNDSSKDRDQRIVRKQERLQACMGGLVNIITSLLPRREDFWLPLIESACGVARLIADAIHDETAMRRSLIIQHVNQEVRGSF